MPMPKSTPKPSVFYEALLSFSSTSLFPISLSLLFPVFMYALCIEKEEKLLEMMKMNGLRIGYYWMVIFYIIFKIRHFMFSLLSCTS